MSGPLTVVLIGYLGFVGLARGSYELTNASGGMAAFWPPNGLIVALLVLAPKRLRAWAPVAVVPGELTADLLQGIHVLTSLGWGLANIVESSLAAGIIFLIARGAPRGESGRNYVALAAGSACAPLVGGLIGAADSVWSFGGGFGSNWLDWWLGDATGILLVTSLIYAFAQPASRLPLRRRVLGTVELAIVVIAAVAVFGFTHLALEFLVLPPVILLAQRQSARWTASASLLFSVVAMVCTGHGLGPLAVVSSASGRVLAVQMFVTTTAFVGFVLCGTMSERRRAEAELARLVAHDHLTGIANRRAFLARLEQLAPIAARELAVAYFDLDGFKQINDTHGHATGDLVLAEVGRRLSAEVRSGDLAARLGGDEFAVVLDPVSNLEDARRVAARLVEAIARPVLVEGVEVPVGASVGVSLFFGDIESALGAADRGLYSQKAARRRSRDAGAVGVSLPSA